MRNPFLAFFLRSFMHLSTRFSGGIQIFIARYKHREALVLSEFRVIVSDTEFDIILIAEGCIFAPCTCKPSLTKYFTVYTLTHGVQSKTFACRQTDSKN